MRGDADIAPTQSIAISESLSLAVFRHAFFLGDRTRQAWTFKTSGLGQECCLTLLIEDEGEAAYPDIAVRLFQLMGEKLGDQGMRPGRALRLGRQGFLGYHSLIFVAAAAFSGLPQLGDHLAILLVHQDEYEYSRRYGIARLLGAIAGQCSVFPFPVWNSILRPSVVADLSYPSVLDSLQAVRSETTVAINRRHITLTMHRDAGLLLFARTLAAEQSATLLCGPPAGAAAALQWDGQLCRALTAATQPERMNLSFLRVQASAANYHRINEDGLDLFLNTPARALLCDAITERRSDDIPLVNHRLLLEPADRRILQVPQAKPMWLSINADRVQLLDIDYPEALVEPIIDRHARAILRFLTVAMSEEHDHFTLAITQTSAGYDVSASIELNPAFEAFLCRELPASDCLDTTLRVAINPDPRVA